MTEQKSIELLRFAFPKEITKPITEEVISMAVTALEKQIPKKIKQEINNGIFERHCPNGCQVTGVTMYADIKYCPYCGQSIKW